MADLKFAKCLNSLPATLQPDTIYMVLKGAKVEMYVSDSAGATAAPVASPGAGAEGIEPLLLTGVTSAGL